MNLWIGKDTAREGNADAEQLYLITGEWISYISVWRRSELMTDDTTEDEINQHYKLIESEYEVKDIGGYKELGEPVYMMAKPAIERIC